MSPDPPGRAIKGTQFGSNDKDQTQKMFHHRNNVRITLRPAAFGWVALINLMGLALLAGGCQHRFPSEQIPKVKFLVLPFTQPATMSDSTMAIRGWWFGARTIRQNERAGDMLADILSRQMARLDYLNLFSSIDLKYYFANKARRLKEYYKKAPEGRDLSDEETAKLIAAVPKLEFAKDLGADKLLTGQIVELYMGQNRTIPVWWSVLDVEVEVVDVATGKVEWTKRYHISKMDASMIHVQELFAGRLIEDLKKEYFLPMARK